MISGGASRRSSRGRGLRRDARLAACRGRSLGGYPITTAHRSSRWQNEGRRVTNIPSWETCCVLGTLGNPWKGSLAPSWALPLRFLFSEGVFTSPDEAPADTVSPAGRSLGPLERFLGLGFDEEYLLWRAGESAAAAAVAAARGACEATAADVESSDAWGAEVATRRAVNGSMASCVSETSIDVRANVRQRVSGVWCCGKAAGCSCLGGGDSKSSVMRPRTPGALGQVSKILHGCLRQQRPQIGPGEARTANGVPGPPGPLVMDMVRILKARPPD